MQNSGLQASKDVYRILKVYLFAYISRWVPLSPDGLFYYEVIRWKLKLLKQSTTGTDSDHGLKQGGQCFLMQ